MAESDSSRRIPLWLDCDPGHDDAFAILFAAYHEKLDLIGVSTVYGNAPLSKTTNNALSILKAIGREDITVHPGRAKPFCRTIVTAPDIHGESGLDGTELLPQPGRTPLMHCNAIKDMRDALMDTPLQTSWLVATGSLTNIALLFATFPEVATHLKGLSIMGGAVGNGFTSVTMGPDFVDPLGETKPRIGNKTPYAEFNIWTDPEASQSVFSNSILRSKTVLIPLDITHQAYANERVRNMLLHAKDEHGKPTRLRRMFNELLMFFAQTYAEVFGLTEGPPLHDPLAVAVLLADHKDPNHRIGFDDHDGERWNVDICLEGVQIGRTNIVQAEEGVMIPRTLDMETFWTVLESCLEKADHVTDHVR